MADGGVQPDPNINPVRALYDARAASKPDILPYEQWRDNFVSGVNTKNPEFVKQYNDWAAQNNWPDANGLNKWMGDYVAAQNKQPAPPAPPATIPEGTIAKIATSPITANFREASGPEPTVPMQRKLTPEQEQVQQEAFKQFGEQGGLLQPGETQAQYQARVEKEQALAEQNRRQAEQLISKGTAPAVATELAQQGYPMGPGQKEKEAELWKKQSEYEASPQGKQMLAEKAAYVKQLQERGIEPGEAESNWEAIKETGGGVLRGALNTIYDAGQGLMTLAAQAQPAPFGIPSEAKSQAIQEFNSELEKVQNKLINQNLTQHEENAAAQVGEALGSTAPYIATGLTGMSARAIIGANMLFGGLAGSQGGRERAQQEIDERRAAEGVRPGTPYTPEELSQMNQMQAVGGGLGLSEGFPVTTMIKPFRRVLGLAVKGGETVAEKMVKGNFLTRFVDAGKKGLDQLDNTTVGGILLSAAEEGIQEAGVQAGENLGVKGIIDNREEIFTDDVLKSGLMGALVGGMIRGVLRGAEYAGTAIEKKQLLNHLNDKLQKTFHAQYGEDATIEQALAAKEAEGDTQAVQFLQNAKTLQEIKDSPDKDIFDKLQALKELSLKIQSNEEVRRQEANARNEGEQILRKEGRKSDEEGRQEEKVSPLPSTETTQAEAEKVGPSAIESTTVTNPPLNTEQNATRQTTQGSVQEGAPSGSEQGYSDRTQSGQETVPSDSNRPLGSGTIQQEQVQGERQEVNPTEDTIIDPKTGQRQTVETLKQSFPTAASWMQGLGQYVRRTRDEMYTQASNLLDTQTKNTLGTDAPIGDQLTELTNFVGNLNRGASGSWGAKTEYDIKTAANLLALDHSVGLETAARNQLAQATGKSPTQVQGDLIKYLGADPSQQSRVLAELYPPETTSPETKAALDNILNAGAVIQDIVGTLADDKLNAARLLALVPATTQIDYFMNVAQSMRAESAKKNSEAADQIIAALKAKLTETENENLDLLSKITDLQRKEAKRKARKPKAETGFPEAAPVVPNPVSTVKEKSDKLKVAVDDFLSKLSEVPGNFTGTAKASFIPVDPIAFAKAAASAAKLAFATGEYTYAVLKKAFLDAANWQHPEDKRKASEAFDDEMLITRLNADFEGTQELTPTEYKAVWQGVLKKAGLIKADGKSNLSAFLKGNPDPNTAQNSVYQALKNEGLSEEAAQSAALQAGDMLRTTLETRIRKQADALQNKMIFKPSKAERLANGAIDKMNQAAFEGNTDKLLIAIKSNEELNDRISELKNSEGRIPLEFKPTRQSLTKLREEDLDLYEDVRGLIADMIADASQTDVTTQDYTNVREHAINTLDYLTETAKPQKPETPPTKWQDVLTEYSKTQRLVRNAFREQVGFFKDNGGVNRTNIKVMTEADIDAAAEITAKRVMGGLGIADPEIQMQYAAEAKRWLTKMKAGASVLSVPSAMQTAAARTNQMIDDLTRTVDPAETNRVMQGYAAKYGNVRFTEEDYAKARGMSEQLKAMEKGSSEYLRKLADLIGFMQSKMPGYNFQMVQTALMQNMLAAPGTVIKNAINIGIAFRQVGRYLGTLNPRDIANMKAKIDAMSYADQRATKIAITKLVARVITEAPIQTHLVGRETNIRERGREYKAYDPTSAQWWQKTIKFINDKLGPQIAEFINTVVGGMAKALHYGAAHFTDYFNRVANGNDIAFTSFLADGSDMDAIIRTLKNSGYQGDKLSELAKATFDGVTIIDAETKTAEQIRKERLELRDAQSANIAGQVVSERKTKTDLGIETTGKEAKQFDKLRKEQLDKKAREATMREKGLSEPEIAAHEIVSNIFTYRQAHGPAGAFYEKVILPFIDSLKDKEDPNSLQSHGMDAFFNVFQTPFMKTSFNIMDRGLDLIFPITPLATYLKSSYAKTSVFGNIQLKSAQKDSVEKDEVRKLFLREYATRAVTTAAILGAIKLLLEPFERALFGDDKDKWFFYMDAYWGETGSYSKDKQFGKALRKHTIVIGSFGHELEIPMGYLGDMMWPAAIAGLVSDINRGIVTDKNAVRVSATVMDELFFGAFNYRGMQMDQMSRMKFAKAMTEGDTGQMGEMLGNGMIDMVGRFNPYKRTSKELVDAINQGRYGYVAKQSSEGANDMIARNLGIGGLWHDDAVYDSSGGLELAQPTPMALFVSAFQGTPSEIEKSRAIQETVLKSVLASGEGFSIPNKNKVDQDIAELFAQYKLKSLETKLEAPITKDEYNSVFMKEYGKHVSEVMGTEFKEGDFKGKTVREAIDKLADDVAAQHAKAEASDVNQLRGAQQAAILQDKQKRLSGFLKQLNKESIAFGEMALVRKRKEANETTTKSKVK